MRQREGWLWLASSFLGDLSSSLTWSSASLPCPLSPQELLRTLSSKPSLASWALRARLALGVQSGSAFPAMLTLGMNVVYESVFALCLRPMAWSLDVFVVGSHICCLPEPACPGCQRLEGQSLQ